MRIDDRKITRGPRARRQLRNRVGQLTRGDRAEACYVGVTSNYEARAVQHGGRSPRFERMVVLFETPDLGVACDVERDLIRHTELKNANRLPGGEGVRPGRDAYYVYVLLEPVYEEAGSLWPWAFGAAGLGLLLLGAGRSGPRRT